MSCEIYLVKKSPCEFYDCILPVGLKGGWQLYVLQYGHTKSILQ